MKNDSGGHPTRRNASNRNVTEMEGSRLKASPLDLDLENVTEAIVVPASEYGLAA
jgi:hypothetical protein